MSTGIRPAGLLGCLPVCLNNCSHISHTLCNTDLLLNPLHPIVHHAGERTQGAVHLVITYKPFQDDVADSGELAALTWRR